MKIPRKWRQLDRKRGSPSLHLCEIEILPADDVGYFMTTTIPDSITMTPKTVWPVRTMTTNEWVRIGTAAVALLLVLNRRLWNSMQLYRPAPMLATGIAWAQFADTYAIGWALIAFAVAGLVWNIRHWFLEEYVESQSTIIRGSSRLHRTTAATDSNIT